MRPRLWAIGLSMALTTPALAGAQTLPTPPLQPSAPVAPNSPSARIAQGWVLVANGRPEDALRIVDELTAAGAGNHDTLALAVAAEIAQKHPDLALSRYERWIKPGTPEDVYLLADIAQGVLVTLTGLAEPNVRAEAAAMLQMRGVAPAPGSTPTEASDLALARLGDAKAVDRVRASLPKLNGGPLVAAIDALGASGSSAAASAVRTNLASPDPMVRAAAATSLGHLKSAADLSALRGLASDSTPWVKQAATLALARLGDPDGRRGAELLLENGASDAKVEAAAALGPDFAARWAPALVPLLNDENLLVRVQAARLLAGAGLSSAETQRTLAEAVASPNPMMRQQATIAFAQGALATPAQLRIFLRDPDPRVRLEAAKAILKLVGR